MNTQTLNNYFYHENCGLLLVIIVFVLLLFSVSVFKKIQTFKKEYKYIKAEIKRSMCEEERLEWKNDLKQLYLTSIPLVGVLFK